MTCRAGIALYVIPGSCTLSRNWSTTFLVFIILNVCSLNPCVCLSLSEKSISYRCFSFIRCMLELPRKIYSRARDQWVKTTLTKCCFWGNMKISNSRSQDASCRNSMGQIRTLYGCCLFLRVERTRMRNFQNKRAKESERKRKRVRERKSERVKRERERERDRAREREKQRQRQRQRYR